MHKQFSSYLNAMQRIIMLLLTCLVVCSLNTKAQTKMSNKNILTGDEDGDHSFDLPCTLYNGVFGIKFRPGTNRVFFYEHDIPGQDQITSRGTYKITKNAAAFKYVTCSFADKGNFKLKYSKQKKLWILLGVCSANSEVEASKE